VNFLRAIFNGIAGKTATLVVDDELDKVSAEEIGNAVRTLYGTRSERRKRQRKRRHVTYKQRDAIAWLLIRLAHERKERTMTRQDWTAAFTEYMTGLSDYPPEDISEAAETAADQQEALAGTDDAALWQNPAGAARLVLNQWNRDAEEAAEAEQPDPDAPPEGGEVTPAAGPPLTGPPPQDVPPGMGEREPQTHTPDLPPGAPEGEPRMPADTEEPRR